MSVVSNKPLPLTPSQAQVWASQRLRPELPLLNESMVWTIRGAVNPDVATRAWMQVLQDVPVLGTTITEIDGIAMQTDGASGTELVLLDFSESDNALEQANSWMHDHIRLPFDAARGLSSSVLIKIADEHWLWLCKQHHVICDAWSMKLIWERFGASYQHMQVQADGSAVSELTPVPLFSQSVAQALDDVSNMSESSEAQAHWAARQSSSPLKPYLRPVAAANIGNTVATRVIAPLNEDRSNDFRKTLNLPGIRSFSTELSAYQLVLTMLSVFLHRITRETRLCISSPVSGRFDDTASITPGQFIEVLPFQIALPDNASIRDVHTQVQTEVMTVLKHARTNSCLNNGSQRANVILNFVNGHFGHFGDFDTDVEWLHAGHVDAHHALRVHVTDWYNTGTPEFAFDFNDALFTPAQRQLALAHWWSVFDAVTMELDQPIDGFSMLQSDEIWQCTDTSSQPVSGKLVHEVVLDNIEQRGPHTENSASRVAIVQQESSIDYATLSVMTAQVQHELLAAGIGRGDTVAVLLPRSWQVMPTILGIMASGAAFVPIDSSQPETRIEHIVQSANAAVLISCNELLSRAPSGRVTININNLLAGFDPASASASGSGIAHVAVLKTLPVSASDAAYILYTSGSTGQPKGVVVSHGALRNYCDWAAETYAANGPSDFPLFTSLGFDLTVTSLFVPLLTGGTLHVYPESDRPDALTLLDVIRDNRVDVIKMTPAHLALLRGLVPADSRVRQLIVGGEDLKVVVAKRAYEEFGSRVAIHNEYGPTEATVGCIVKTFDPASDTSTSVPIGLPVAGMQALVVNDAMQPQLQGVPGELYLAGPSLADGYWQDPGQTAASFVQHAVNPSTRMYRTGDLVRVGESGNFEYIGRVDEQLSVKGVRVEATEIEAAVLAHCDIGSAVATLTSNNCASTEEIHCIECGLSSRYPNATINNDGICSLCLNFEKYSDRAEKYFGTLPELERIADKAKLQSSGKYDCMLLLSGGKDSTYALARVQDLGLSVLAYTLDNGFLSDEAMANIKRVCKALNVDHQFATTDAMNAIFVDSLQRFSNVCNGCFKTIYTLSMKHAQQLGIPLIITGLSRGQFFETRLTEELFTDESLTARSIDGIILDARKAYHRLDDVVSRLMDVDHLADDGIFDKVQIVDFYRYCDVELQEMLDYLDTRVPWIRPSDTGRSTNCLINDIGIAVHKRERGFHNYSFPYSWDVRLGHKQRDEALQELEDDIDEQHVQAVLDEIGYVPSDDVDQQSRRLVVYYTSEKSVTDDELRVFLSDRLPAQMMPDFLIRLETLPLSTNGKIDKRKLPQPNADQARLSIIYSPPENDCQRILCDAWQRLLKLQRVGIHDNFFAIGGDSLLAIRVTAEVNHHGYQFKPTDIFNHQSIAQLATLERVVTPENTPDVAAFESVDKQQLDKLAALLNRPAI